MPKLFFEDLSLGLSWQAGPLEVTQDDIIAFARQFDPQPFHTDPEAAAAHRLFRGLAASGWHTAALSMRLFATAETVVAGGIIGNGIDELRWPRPVRPGDRLSLSCEVVELRPPAPGKAVGWARIRNTALNQNGEPVQTLIATLSIPCRPPA